MTVLFIIAISVTAAGVCGLMGGQTLLGALNVIIGVVIGWTTWRAR